ncbi:hypothetical protein JX266_013786 [Neoarthrinium moseri]|nr:hypothetical protein JX266_013786 [Neoarthrinium moseri]
MIESESSAETRELQGVKKVFEQANIPGSRVLRDQLYPVKVNNVNRTEVLDEQGIILPGAGEALWQENDLQIAKISWLSNKANGKAYGSMGNQHTPNRSTTATDHYTRCADDAQGKVITTETARQQNRSAHYAVAHTSPPASPAEGYISRPMDHNFRTLQLNVRRQDTVQLSLMNDSELRDYGIIAIQEPNVRRIDNAIISAPRRHANWTKMLPMTLHDRRWAAGAMLWINTKLDATQVPVRNANVTAALVKVADRVVLVASVYIPSNNAVASREMISQLRDLGRQASHSTDYLYIGDFNLHDQVWGGDGVSQARQGEADHLIDMMNELGLMSMLPRGTKTWQRDGRETTIDLVLTSEGLARDTIACGIHPTEHGSDHRAIEATFGTRMPVKHAKNRLLLRNAPWEEIRTRIADTLKPVPTDGTVQQRTDRIMSAVLEAVHALTPRAKPSTYAKRWRTMDLTKLRKTCTYWRNQARSRRRSGRTDPGVEHQAREAGKTYHTAIRKQKKTHWHEFLEENANIWQAARYLDPDEHSAFDKIPPLKRADGTTTGADNGRGRETDDGSQPVESRWRGWPPGDGMEAGVAGRQGESAFPLSAVVGHGRAPAPMAPSQDHPAEEGREAGLREGEGLETDLAALHAREDSRVGDCGTTVISGGDDGSAADQPLWRAEAEVGGTSTDASARADLQGLAITKSSQPGQLHVVSFFLGGKSRSDPDKWTPNLAAVKATIAYAKATGRLQWEQ